MRLLSVNVGVPRSVTYRGRTYMTSIFKQPVSERVMLGHLNVDGDAQGNKVTHGGTHMAVYVYSFDHYAHWAAELGRGDLAPGAFGENFTVDGMTEDRVRIGDRYRIGGAVVEISEPRTPCHKLAMRMDSQTFPKAFLASGRVGFYCRVLEEGEVGAGDAIEKVASDPGAMTVGEVMAVWRAGGKDTDGMRRALSLAALSPSWREVFAERLGGGAPAR